MSVAAKGATWFAKNVYGKMLVALIVGETIIVMNLVCRDMVHRKWPTRSQGRKVQSHRD